MQESLERSPPCYTQPPSHEDSRSEWDHSLSFPCVNPSIAFEGFGIQNKTPRNFRALDPQNAKFRDSAKLIPVSAPVLLSPNGLQLTREAPQRNAICDHLLGKRSH